MAFLSTGFRASVVIPRQGVGMVSRRRPTKIRATESEEEEQSSFFTRNRLSGRGYLEEDSAGQENIFAIQPKSYAQGSAMDDTTGSAGNTVFGVGGAALGILVVIAGITALLVQSATDNTKTEVVDDFTGLSTLSEYKSKFEARSRAEAVVEAPTPAAEL